MNPDLNPRDFAYAMAMSEVEQDAERIIRSYARWCREAGRKAETIPNRNFYAALAVVLGCAIDTDRHNFAVLVTTMLSIDIARAHTLFADWYATMPSELVDKVDSVRQAMRMKEGM